MVGSHLIKAWSSTQASVALSIGEAEYYGLVRGVGIGIEIQSLYRDSGLPLKLRAWTGRRQAARLRKSLSSRMPERMAPTTAAARRVHIA